MNELFQTKQQTQQALYAQQLPQLIDLQVTSIPSPITTNNHKI